MEGNSIRHYWSIIVFLSSPICCFWTNGSLGVTVFPQHLRKTLHQQQSNHVDHINTRNDAPYFYDRADIKTLRSVQVIHRHGMRSPIISYPTDPQKNFDYGVKGFGQLTPKGQRQGYELGKYLRKRYAGYLSPNYSYDQVFVRSSDVDRTIMTAEMVLAGMYPVTPKKELKMKLHNQFNWQPIPLHTIPTFLDNKINPTARCPEKDRLYKVLVDTPTVTPYLKPRNEWLYDYIATNTGLLDLDLDLLQRLIDNLIVAEQNGLELPDWTKPIFPKKLMPFFNLIFTVNTTTPEMKGLELGPLLSEMIQNFELEINGRPSSFWTSEDLKYYHFCNAKIYLFSGHDTTIAKFLDAFDLFDGEQPMYTSALIFELHQQNITTHNKDEDLILKLFYKKERKKPIQDLNLKKCPSPCSLSNFRRNFKEFLLGDSVWHSDCVGENNITI